MLLQLAVADASHNLAYWDMVIWYVVRINCDTAVTASPHSVFFCFAFLARKRRRLLVVWVAKWVAHLAVNRS